MGYCVKMQLENVVIPEEKQDQAIKILTELNKKWIKENDWCRFDSYTADSLDEIIEEIGFSCSYYEDGSLEIEDFEREKLGGHEEMFIALSPVLEDCSIRFFGEDDNDWKIIIENHEFETIYRESW